MSWMPNGRVCCEVVTKLLQLGHLCRVPYLYFHIVGAGQDLYLVQVAPLDAVNLSLMRWYLLDRSWLLI